MSDEKKQDDNVIQFPQLSKLEKALEKIENPDVLITTREACLIAWTVNENIRRDVQRSLDSVVTEVNAALGRIDSRIANIEQRLFKAGL